MTEGRVAELERKVDGMHARLQALERSQQRVVRNERVLTPEPVREPVRPAPAQPTPSQRVVWGQPEPPRAERPARTPDLRERLGGSATLEDLLGGRVLAWVGGLAVLLGVVFLFAVAISQGWIGETARTLFGAAGSAGLLGLGVWLHERRARTDAALAAVAAGIAGLFVSTTVASTVYDLVPVPAGLCLTVAVGALATALAVRWEARGIAALGIVGALLAPVLSGAPGEGGSIAVLFVAGASAVGVLLWQRWRWLALAVFAVATPQWVGFLTSEPRSLEVALLTLCSFTVLGVVAAVGHELRAKAAELDPGSGFLLALNALAAAAAGAIVFDALGQETLMKLWVAGLAAAHVAVGLGGRRDGRVSPDLALLALVLGVALGDVAFGMTVDGPALAIGWSAAGIGFALLMRHRGSGSIPDHGLTSAGLGAHVALAVVHALAWDASPSAIVGDGLTAAAAASLLAVAAGCFVSGRLADAGHPMWRGVLDTLALASVAYLTLLALDGWQLAAAWAVEAVALAAVAQRTRDELSSWAALGYLALAALGALVVAPPDALFYGLEDPPAGALALGSAALAALVAATRVIVPGLPARPVLMGAAALVLLHLASALIVTPFQPGAGTDVSVLDLDVRQQGQMLLSVFWATVGVTTLVAGLRRDSRVLRLAALGLLFTAVAKVFLFDLATLTSVYRVVSLIGLGLLLLAGAFVWQRMRPRELPDLRETPAGVR